VAARRQAGSPEAQLVAEVQQAFAPLADEARAAAMAAYMKGQFRYLGIPTPARRAATRPLLRAFAGDAVRVAELLWGLEPREYQYVACDLLRIPRLGPEALAAIEGLVQQKSWWDTVDSLAPAVGEIVLREKKRGNLDPAARMDELIAHENLWLRRVAILHQLAWKRETDQERLFAYCLRCAGEKEFFIRKAIGWALRQQARVAPEAVRSFVDLHRARLSPLTAREATKHLGSRMHSAALGAT
jgi:3-methyladenine DNA glycosylase AlkD